MERIQTKICIIGGGPAGATTSIFLGKLGIEHTLVDAAVFPRDKVCGDGLDLNVIRVLNHIDPSIVTGELLPEDSPFTISHGLRFILGNGKNVDINAKSLSPGLEKGAVQPVFFVGKRADFDALLIKKINRECTTVKFGTRITGITKEGGCWKLSGKSAEGPVEIIADFIVGADGDQSVIVKHIGIKKVDRANYAGALRQYWSGVKGTHSDHLLEIYFPERLPLSYFWIFPLPDGKANVGYGMASHHISKMNINIRNEFDNLIKTDPVLKERFKNAQPEETVKGWGVPMSGSGRKPNGDGWLLVGDAASLVCPTSGEGIGSGMISGYIASKFIARACKEGDFSEKMFANYYREIHKRLRTEEKLFRFANGIPVWAFTKLLGFVLNSKWFISWFGGNQMRQWIDTAYTKELKVNLD